MFVVVVGEHNFVMYNSEQSVLTTSASVCILTLRHTAVVYIFNNLVCIILSWTAILLTNFSYLTFIVYICSGNAEVIFNNTAHQSSTERKQFPSYAHNLYVIK